MRINRLLVIGLMATSLLASCKKDINSDDQGNGITFTARTEQNRDGSRTYIEPEGLDQDDSADVLWAEDDHILVSNGSETLDFGLTDGDHTTEGTFYTGGDHDDFFVHDYLALYPSANAEDVPNTLDFQTGIATFHLPSTQVLDRENSFANKTMPMVCHDTDEDLDFKNVFGGLIIPLMIDEEFYDMWGIESIRVDRVVLTSLKADDKLWGTFTADCRSDNPLPTHISGDGGNTLTLTCDLTLGTEEYTNFIFIVPPGSLSEGFKVEAYYGAAKVYEELFDWATEEHGFAIPRRVLMKVATHLYNEDNVDFDPSVIPFTIQPTYISIHSAWAMGGNYVYYLPAESDYAEYNVPSYASFVYAKASDVGDDPANLLVLDGANVHVVPCTGEYISPSGNDYFGTLGFEAPLEGLEEDQIYYVRSYVVNPYGEGYGEPVPFATRYDYYGRRNGMSRKTFSVSDDTQVYFSMGNLQYRAQPSTWRFADYQFEFVGAGVFPVSAGYYHGNGDYDIHEQYNYVTVWGNVFANGQHPHDEGNGIQSDNNENGENYSQWIDIYGYGCSNYAHRARLWHPWEVEFVNYAYNSGNHYMGNIAGYFAYDDPTANLYDHTGKAEWGYNSISNGGNGENQWRTLTGCQNTQSSPDLGERGEWRYLLHGRQTSNPYVCAQAVLCVRGDFRRTIDPNAWEPNSTLYEVSNLHRYDNYQHEIGYCGYQVGGLILFPDGFDPADGLDDYFDFTGIITRGLNKFEGNNDYYSDELSEAEWSLLEHFGAVFLPETGIRLSPDQYEYTIGFGRPVYCPYIILHYWSSSCPVMKNDHGIDIPAWNGLRIDRDGVEGEGLNGFASVRLVKNAR